MYNLPQAEERENVMGERRECYFYLVVAPIFLSQQPKLYLYAAAMKEKPHTGARIRSS